MSASPSDEELLRRIRADEPGAFEDFVATYGETIYGFGMRVCGEREDAREVFQDTLLQVYRSLEKLEHAGALRTWLYRVTANACLMKRRKGNYAGNREVPLEELMPRSRREAEAEIPDTTALPDDQAARSELRQRVRQAVRRLPDHYRIVLVLRDMEMLSTAETAAALDLPVSTIKMRLHRARLMVRKMLVDDLQSAASGETPPESAAGGSRR